MGACLSLSCQKDCSQIACTTYVDVGFAMALADEGAYALDVVADGQSMECRVHVPSGPEDHCDEKLGLVWGETTGGQAGAGGGAMQELITGMGVIGIYEELTIAIRFDGDEIVSDTFAPEYEEPSGDCGGCPRAEYVLRF